MDKVLRWRETLTKAANLSGWSFLADGQLESKPKIKSATSTISSPVSPPHAVPPTPHRPQPPLILIKTEIGIERERERPRERRRSRTHSFNGTRLQAAGKSDKEEEEGSDSFGILNRFDGHHRYSYRSGGSLIGVRLANGGGEKTIFFYFLFHFFNKIEETFEYLEHLQKIC
nr:uncharacterized protein LOC108170411 isoform X2 [Malus domestica]